MSVLGWFLGVRLYHGRIIKMRKSLKQQALRAFLYAKVAISHAHETKAVVQASWLPAIDE